ncbi:MAG: nuclear transport factor 2 family protein [Marmoricola sp.]
METDTLCRITPDAHRAGELPAWPVAGGLLDALTRRDFDALAGCLETGVRFRALVPPGPFELGSAAEVGAKFTAWFGGDDAFEVLDASASQIGDKVCLRWRIRMTGTDSSARVAEQHVYLTGAERIATIDLLCSGFHAEQPARVQS